MKKLFMLFMAAGLFTACNNDKTAAKADKEEKKDTTTTTKPAETTTTTTSTDNTGSTGGWPASEVTGFINSCINSATAGGMDRPLATTYCECMQVKMEKLYPDVRDAAKLTDADMQTPEMKKEIQKCLGKE